MTRRHQMMCLWGFGWRPIILRGSKPKNFQKGAWLGIFQPKWQNYKIVISPAGNNGSIPNFDRIIEPHSWLRGWSRITKFIFKMADGRHIAKCWKRYKLADQWTDLDETWVLASHRVSDMSPHNAVAMAAPLPSNGALYIQQLWASGGQTREPILLKFGTQQQLGPQWQSRDQILKFVKFKMADGRHVGKYSKCHISPTNSPTGTQLEWSHPIMFSTCPRCCCCHGNGRCRCVATVHWTFCSYGRLQAERVNQFWWNLVHNSKLGAQWQSRDQILKFLEFKMADGRHVGKYWKYHNSPSNGLIGTNPGWSHPITFPTCPP